jgi:hypothetical protein
VLLSLSLTTEQFEASRTFGDAGAYELLSGRAEFAIQPAHPLNSVLTDLDLAPRDADGCVRCTADVSILRPRDPLRRNRGLLLDVVNRGNRGLPRAFDVHPAPPTPGRLGVGDGWLLEQGYTIVACGWQHDVPDAAGLLRIDVPQLTTDGRPVTGRVACRYHVTVPATVQLLADGQHVPYSAVDIDEAGATLTVRDNPADEPRLIPRDRWQFARIEDGRAVASTGHIHLPDGFEPGKFYEVMYTATGAVPTGLGLAATRDLLSHLRYGAADSGNPCAGDIDYTLAFGSSQSGGFLRKLLYLGMCEDEAGRPVVDGMLPNIAGAFNLELNWRFGQPSYYGPYGLSYVFPFADADQREPNTGRVDGLQHRARERGALPRVIYTNTSAEYWYLYGALAHLNLSDATDVELPDNVRVYHFAGAQHGGATFPPTRERPGVDGPAAVHALNTVDPRPLLRAALLNLDRWVREEAEPPPSRYPRVSDETLVPPERLRVQLPRIPGASLPQRLFEAPYLDFGPEPWHTTTLPPQVGPLYPTRVPAVDADGNDLGGIRLPDLTVPLATHTGWNARDARIGATDHVGPTLAGASIPFARTKTERIASTDDRASIEERYTDKSDYLNRVRAAAEALVHERYLLASDVDYIVHASGERYEAFTGATPAPVGHIVA